MRKMYIDLETLPSETPPSPDEIQPPKNYKDPAKIHAYQEDKIEESHRKQSLDSMQGRILCIGYAFDDEPANCIYDTNADEQALLSGLSGVIDKHGVQWVGHNIRSFDLLWIYRKAIKYGLYHLAWSIPTARYTDAIVDTMDLWSGPAWKEYCKLDAIAQFLGIPNKNGFDGSMVYDAWLTGEHGKIQEYCKQDVEMVRAIYKRINGET